MNNTIINVEFKPIFHIRKNDFFALIGPTGSGKSLMLEGIMGLVPFSSGSLLLDGHNITKKPVEKRNIAIVYQDFALFPHLDVMQNITYGVKYHNISKKEAGNRFDFLISTLGLNKIISRSSLKLSGGEKQRVALARSLILNPKVLLLDEPLSALDPIYHEEAKNLLKVIHDNMEITIIMVSHNFADVMYLANRGAIINNGQIEQQGQIVSVFEKPNSKNLENCFIGKIKRISNNGIYLNVYIETQKFIFEAIWPRSYLRDYDLDVGKEVEFGFHPESIHTF